jgi:hypothetical protein
MGNLRNLYKLELEENENLSLSPDSILWRLKGLEELTMKKLPNLKGNNNSR